MPIERRDKTRLPTWQFLLRTVGFVFFGGAALVGAYHSLSERSGSITFSLAAVLLLSICFLGLPIAFYAMRIGHQHGDRLLQNYTDAFSFPFNRRPDLVLTISLLAVVPELTVWAYTESDHARSIFLWCLAGVFLLFASAALWSWFTARAPLLIDREGLQMPDLWTGTLVWRDIEAVIPARGRLALAFKKRPDIVLKKRPWYSNTARWAGDDRVLLMYPPLRYLSLNSFVSVLRDRAGLKGIPKGVVQKTTQTV